MICLIHRSQHQHDVQEHNRPTNSSESRASNEALHPQLHPNALMVPTTVQVENPDPTGTQEIGVQQQNQVDTNLHLH